MKYLLVQLANCIQLLMRLLMVGPDEAPQASPPCHVYGAADGASYGAWNGEA